MAGMTEDRIRNGYEVTPSQVASQVIKEDRLAWFVACEGGCDRVITVAKREYVPITPPDPNTQYDARIYTAPGARRCAVCGPWPGSPAALALEAQRNR